MSRVSSIETLRRGQILVVRVSTEDGWVGIGQTAPYEVALTEQVLHTMVAPFFLGRQPRDVEELVDGCLRTHYKFLGGFLHRAVGGVDTALWDIVGQAAGRPVHQLLGSAGRTHIPMYLSSMRRDLTAEQESRRLAQAIDQDGFQAVKIRVGAPMGRDVDEWPGRTEAIVPHMRAALGAQIDISADANGGFSVPRAIEVGRMLQDHGYFHFEEPCPYPDIEGTAQVNAALQIPVSGGEQDFSMAQLGRIVQMRAVDIVQPDIGYLGGISRARRVAELAQESGIVCTPHCANRSLLQVFTLHLASAMPACSQLQEWSAEQPLWTADVYRPVLAVRDGVVQVPTEPGWGVELDPEFVRTAERRVTTTSDTATAAP